MSATAAKPAAAPDASRKRRPRRKLPNPSTQMLEQLMRFKREGWPFELAWDRAWRNIRWPDKREPRDEWKNALRSMRSTWQRNYQDEGAPVDIALVVEAISKELDATDLTLVA